MPLRVAVIGTGSMGSNHLRVLYDMGNERVTIVGVADAFEESLRQATHRYQIKGYKDFRQLLIEQKPDLVTIAVPTSSHFEVASAVIQSGIHVLIEKPITHNVAEAEALIQLAKDHHVKIAVGHVERFNPAVQALKKFLDEGKLGKILHLSAKRLGPFPVRIGDVGVILDLAPHDIDVMCYLTGSPVERVYAETQRILHQKHEDLLTGLVRFSNGVSGMLDINWLTPTKVRELTVTGERGMCVVNYLTQDLYYYENDYTTMDWESLRTLTGVSEGTMTRLKVKKVEPLRLEFEDVIGAIEHNTSLTVPGEDGLAVLKTVQQLLFSAQHQEVVRNEILSVI